MVCFCFSSPPFSPLTCPILFFAPFAGRINTASSSAFSPPPPQSPKTQLMSSSVVLRMADFSIYQVTQKKTSYSSFSVPCLS